MHCTFWTVSLSKVRRAGRLTAAFVAFAAVMLLVSPAPAEPAEPPQQAYKLKPGDEVAISVLPQKAYDCGGVLLPDGVLHLRNVGAVKATGMTLEELAENVRQVLSEKLVSPRVMASITRLAPATPPPTGTVTVIGGVAKTGPLNLEEGLRVYKALELAGGAARNADLSRVTILHKDLTRTVVDISSPERISNPQHNLALKDGDSIEVPLLPLKLVSIAGAVGKPGLLYLDEGLRLRRALELAGGAAAGADLTRVTIYHKDLTRVTVDLSTPEKVSDATQNVMLQDGDLVEVPLVPVTTRLVRIGGQVQNPGQFAHRPGMCLEDLITAAGKLTPVADLEQIKLQRKDQPARMINLLEQQKLGLEGKVPLEPEDEVFVPEHENTVVMIGAVPKPGAVALKDGQTILDFFTDGSPEVAAAFNPAVVDLANVQILRRGQAPVKLNLKDALLKRDRKRETVALRSGDVIFMPPREAKVKKGPLEYLQQLGPLGFLFGAF